jgi:hypothetical protein
MRVILLNVEDVSNYGTFIENIESYDKNTYTGVDVDEIIFTEPVMIRDGVQMIKWFETNYEMYLTQNKLELFRKKIMDTCHLNEIFSFTKMKSILIDFIERHDVVNVYSLIEFAYEYPSVLLPEQNDDKESIPSVYIMFKPLELDEYKDDVNKYGHQVSIKQHSIMMELPMDVLKTFYGLPTKISQVFRSLFPNTWAQAYFNFTSYIIIHPLKNGNMIVITSFNYYHGYMEHPNTLTMLDNIKTVQFLKHRHVVLPLINEYKLDIPFPIIYGVSDEFKVEDENMNVKVACYHPDLTFGEEIELFDDSNDESKIPGDVTFGFLDNKYAFDPYQYHYVLRRITRYLYGYTYRPYRCIMSMNDLPNEVMYFKL